MSDQHQEEDRANNIRWEERRLELAEREVACREKELRSKSSWWLAGTLIVSLIVSTIGAVTSSFASRKVAETTERVAIASAASAKELAEFNARSSKEIAILSATDARRIAEYSAQSARNLASFSAESAFRLSESQWQKSFYSTLRKSQEDAVLSYVNSLYVAVGLAQKLTADAALLGIEPTLEQYRAFDLEQRKNLIAIDLAATALQLECPKIVSELEEVYRQFAAVDELIAKMMYYNFSADRKRRWLDLNAQLVNIHFAEKLRVVRKRFGVQPARHDVNPKSDCQF